ncbi:hypothetical protein L1887_35417 [Cichorium endivia]|nr:hypothetical protein L1887_35417 [Cichorium endivia]
MKINFPSRQQRAFITAIISVLLVVIISIAFVTGVPQYGSNSSTLMNTLGEVLPDQIGGDKCSKSDIVINQGPTSPLPSGIPMYTVEITNICATGCDISGIHFSCGWFSSARLINPHLFKRLRFNDCLVNDGKPLINGRTVSFQYANSFPYPLSVSSVVCR